MIEWRKQERAVIGTLRLSDNRVAKAVLVGPASNPKGALLLLANPAKEAVETLVADQFLPLLTPHQAISICCMQERAFGEHGLLPPALPQSESS